MGVKIIFSDIDGTFLNSKKKVTDLTVKAIHSLLEKNLKFVLVSARMPEAIYPILDTINLPRIPIISYSGALVLNEYEKILYDKKISAENSKNILTEVFNRWEDISVGYYSGRKWYVQKIDHRIEYEMNSTKVRAEIENFSNLIEKNILPNKIFIRCEPPTCKEMDFVLNEKFKNLNIVRSAPHLLEIMDKTVTKAEGIKILLDYYGITKDEAAAFGDNYNDIEMLKYIPRSVAMANAPDGVKKYARFITDSNDDSGIYTYLKKIEII
ncbi:MAG: HAD family phosphatase [Selenomonadaceae bacterium]|nr:HAD family phosphatase [Selenomonadaceae bacterium]